MPADVKLSGEQVVIEAPDLVLHSKVRQGPAPGDQRRALVHDDGDRLTLNWGHDYIGGINLVGVKRISAYSPPGIIALDRDEIEIDGVVKGARIEVEWEAYTLTHDGLSGAFWMPIPEGQPTEHELNGLVNLFVSRLMECGRWIMALDSRLMDAETTIAAHEQRIAAQEAAMTGALNRISQLLARVEALEAKVGTG